MRVNQRKTPAPSRPRRLYVPSHAVVNQRNGLEIEERPRKGDEEGGWGTEGMIGEI